ncbi:MAG: hypothetical protein LBG17_00250 [Bacteroidales bacterium]|jgi:hypothetical protein|nr:hypothetical protein [Bacteroidales bacterium]
MKKILLFTFVATAILFACEKEKPQKDKQPNYLYGTHWQQDSVAANIFWQYDTSSSLYFITEDKVVHTRMILVDTAGRGFGYYTVMTDTVKYRIIETIDTTSQTFYIEGYYHRQIHPFRNDYTKIDTAYLCVLDIQKERLRKSVTTYIILSSYDRNAQYWPWVFYRKKQ